MAKGKRQIRKPARDWVSRDFNNHYILHGLPESRTGFSIPFSIHIFLLESRDNRYPARDIPIPIPPSLNLYASADFPLPPFTYLL